MMINDQRMMTTANMVETKVNDTPQLYICGSAEISIAAVFATYICLCSILYIKSVAIYIGVVATYIWLCSNLYIESVASYMRVVATYFLQDNNKFFYIFCVFSQDLVQHHHAKMRPIV